MRHREHPGKKSLFASAGVHVVAVILAWSAQVSGPDPSQFITYEITLVSPPPTQEAPEPSPVVEEEVVVETPEPVLEEEPQPVVEEDQPREEDRPTPTPTPTETEEDPGDPEPSETISGEDLNIRMEGLQRDFPEYYANIQRQIQRCFEYRGGGRLETSIIFYISKDGSVDGRTIDFYERSGNVNFDYAAMGAIECAGSGRFGPLPEELGWDRLPILFTFRPGGDEGPLTGVGSHAREASWPSSRSSNQ
jgi:hypothetical protein